MKIDYKKNLTEITVKSQAELDDIPSDFGGMIYVEFGTFWNKAIIIKRYMGIVVLRGNSSAVLRGNSSAVLRGNSSAVLRDNSSAELWENSSAELWENSSAELRGNSSAELWENSSAELWENSSAVLRENSSAVLRGNSSAVLRENSSAELWENSSAELWENSSAVANGNTQIVDRQTRGRIEITGNARIVYMPKTIDEYCVFYGIKHDKKKGRFYKCVRKCDGRYVSDYDRHFEYKIGEKAISNEFDTDEKEDCGHGIHIAHMAWALDYGRDWDELAILEVEANLDSIVVPVVGSGKLRCPEVEVIREVPLEECGGLGKILAKRRTK